jgi:hypothetical protein
MRAIYLLLLITLLNSCSNKNNTNQEKQTNTIKSDKEIISSLLDSYIKNSQGLKNVDTTRELKWIFSAFSKANRKECIVAIPYGWGRYSFYHLVLFSKDSKNKWFIPNVEFEAVSELDTMSIKGRTIVILERDVLGTGGLFLQEKWINSINENYNLKTLFSAECEDNTSSYMQYSGKIGDTIINCTDFKILNDLTIESTSDIGIINKRINEDSVTYNLESNKQKIKNWW